MNREARPPESTISIHFRELFISYWLQMFPKIFGFLPPELLSEIPIEVSSSSPVYLLFSVFALPQPANTDIIRIQSYVSSHQVSIPFSTIGKYWYLPCLPYFTRFKNQYSTPTETWILKSPLKWLANPVPLSQKNREPVSRLSTNKLILLWISCSSQQLQPALVRQITTLYVIP